MTMTAYANAVPTTEYAVIAADIAKKTREEFLSRMSHELRTPLNAVIGLSRVLETNRAGNQRPEDIELLARVRASGEQLLRLVEAVLDQARISRGELSLNLADTDVVALTRRVIVKYAGIAAEKGIAVSITLPESAPTCVLDAARLEQALGYVLDNAVKFTSSGTIRIVMITDAATRQPRRIMIADSGIGIAPDKLESVFEPFHQVDESSRRAYGGAGLGLPIARSLCEAMGGGLILESELGVGSRVTIKLPDPRRTS